MADRILHALIHGSDVGTLRLGPGGRPEFEYTESWRRTSGAYPISLSMPLGQTTHGSRVVTPYLWGLLPDNPGILDQWARRFQVSAANPFALLQHVGEDCSGAVQFLTPPKRSSLRKIGLEQVQWMTDADVAERLRILRGNHGASRIANDSGQFSLAGAQPKIALLRRNGRYGIPSRRTPTTHILKPPIPGRIGHVENEHFCLRLGDRLGMRVAQSEVCQFKDELAIVVTRFDRVSAMELAAEEAARADLHGGPDAKEAWSALYGAMFETLQREWPIRRVHQEDLCQATGRSPSRKNQSDGGPTPAQVATLFREHSSDPVADLASFFDALALNWLIAGTDGHGKNFSILHGEQGGRVRLAPLYDLASSLVYEDIRPERAKLAMRVGRKYRIRDLRREHWEALAKSDFGLDSEQAVNRIATMAESVPDYATVIRDEMLDEGLNAEFVGELAEAVSKHARWCRRMLLS